MISWPPTARSLILAAAGTIRWQETPLPQPGRLAPGDVLLRTLFSSFKHGTETAYYHGDCPFQSQEFDLDTRTFVPRVRPLYPFPLGNMSVGTVLAVGEGVKTLACGDRVFGWLGVADYHVCQTSRLEALGRLTPEQAVTIDPAVFALGAIHDAELNLRGKTVLVTGLGAIGQLVVQFASSAGATVLVASQFAVRRDLARQHGATHAFDPREVGDLGGAVKKWTGLGVDVAFECSGHYPQLHQGLRATRQHGCVVTVGFYRGEGTGLRLGEEFFHNRLTIKASLPAFRFANCTRGESPRSYNDLKAQVVDALQTGRLSPDGMLHPPLPFTEAEQAFRLIVEHPEQVIKVAIRYP